MSIVHAIERCKQPTADVEPTAKTFELTGTADIDDPSLEFRLRQGMHGVCM